ncbi:MAG TPA: WecB/TagA/CpsF family glycosyltransferase [Pirellulales bacterium]|jgi:N-acetylglucosaminyldiphosphoundecaprenol N-acetyl-beta-D-mannosaminyltransferase|nr:WecB/TagA/CpsF family glycosyltransferase [Pirellulales bacterium]
MNRVRLFGFEVDALRMREAVAQLLKWAVERDGVCRFVVTPNADHAVLFQENMKLRQAYASASLVLVDGMPLLLAAKLLRRGVPERVPGSDLVPALFSAAGEGPETRRSLRIYLLGAAPGVAERAADRIKAMWTGVDVVGCYSPPLGFERNPGENEAILARIAQSKCDVLIVGLGAPKQELWVLEHQTHIAAPVALCVGATIDFLAGEKARAPRWMRCVGLEWLHRLGSEPRRLARRYLRDAIHLPRLLWREIRGTTIRPRSPATTRTTLSRSANIE